MKASKEGLTLAGSILAGVTASICCVVPVAFALLGIGGASFALAFEPYRPLLIGLTILLLGGAFLLVYRIPASTGCAAECAPLPDRTRIRRLLWITAIVVLGLLTFPYYAGRITSSLSANRTDLLGADTVTPALSRTVVPIQGMTCAGCSSAVELALLRVDGISAAKVDHERGTATISHEDRVSVDRILEVISRAGFKPSEPLR